MLRRPNLALPFLPLLATVVVLAACSSGGPPPLDDASGLTAAPATAPAADDVRAAELARRGLAELENEAPGEAVPLYRELSELRPADPLGPANLAIAQLRQQEIEAALEASAEAVVRAEALPDDTHLGQVLAIRGAVLDWQGEVEEALAVLERAARAAPADPEVVYGFYRLASLQGGPELEESVAWALERLTEMRPENVVVLLQAGRRAVEVGDRSRATAAYGRLAELVWQAPPAARTVLDDLLAALEAAPADGAQAPIDDARLPAARLENVLKITPMYRESLRELATGIQGVPLARLADQPPPTSFGSPVPVTFRAQQLSDIPTRAGGLALADLDGDRRPDLARLVDGPPGGLELRLAMDGFATVADVLAGPLPASSGGLLAADLANDGGVDLLAYGPDVATFWSGRPAEEGTTGRVSFERQVENPAWLTGATAAVVLDHDIEGDLDLVLATGGDLALLRNTLEPEAAPGEAPSPLAALEPVGGRVFSRMPEMPEVSGTPTDLVATDLDRDGDLDLLVGGPGGVRYLSNLRQGTFADHTEEIGLAEAIAGRAVGALTSADLDGDGLFDPVLAVGEELVVLHHPDRIPDRLAVAPSPPPSPGVGEIRAVVAFDADNDGRLDLAVGGAGGVAVLGQVPDGGAGTWRRLPVDGFPGPVTPADALVATDADGDGDLDLVVGGPGGLHLLDNEGGDANGWLAVDLRGLVTGNSKNNLAGIGSLVEVSAGSATQAREHDGTVTWFGLGDLANADLLRVVWTNGVPQNRLDPAGDQLVVEEQLLKGSCPFLYAWRDDDGDGIPEMTFVTDLLWGAPAGLPVAPGVWVPADEDELVAVPGAVPVERDGRPMWEFQITEELWEAAYFDRVRLWVVDSSEEVEVASALRIAPGETAPQEVRASRDLRPVAAAWDGRGDDVTDLVAHRDERYADGYQPSRWQGLADEPWTFTFDLGEAPAAPVRLHLAGWIFPADASLNLAIAQKAHRGALYPRLEVELPSGEWVTLIDNMGHPAGKTKTMVVDTPPLPPGASRLRIVTSLWLHWDRIAWSTEPDDSAARVVARLAPSHADLHWRGFSEPVRSAPNAPHGFDYSRVRESSPWLPFPGPYTRFGDVRELLETTDGRSVILGAGDEMTLRFDASELPPVAPGHRRTVFLESRGWDKDADRNTWAVESGTLPLPIPGVAYPPGPEADPASFTVGEPSGETLERLERYRDEWLTRPEAGPPPQ